MSDSPGQILQRARQDRGLSLEAVSKATHIRQRYLQALEADDLPGLPSLVQGKGFLRLYAGYLGLDESALLENFGTESPAPDEAVSENQQGLQPPAIPLIGQISPDKSPPFDIKDLPKEDIHPTEKTDQIAKGVKPSQQIFDEIGGDLRKQREQLSLSLAEVEKHTHVRTHYLKALEDGRMQDMPSFVQARGLLANYAHFLNLDSEAFLLRFADGLQARRVELAALQAPEHRQAAAQREASNPLLRRILSVDLLVTGGLIVILVTFVTWGASRVLTLKAEQKTTATHPAVIDVLLATPSPLVSESAQSEVVMGKTPVVTEDSAAEIPTLMVSLPAPGSGAIQLSVVARQRTWLRMTVDGKVKYNGRTTPGNVYTFDGNKQVELLAGSGSALQAYFNGTDLGVLGSTGQVINLIFTPGGMVNPTASLEATVTNPPRNTTPTPTTKPGAIATTKP